MTRSLIVGGTLLLWLGGCWEIAGVEDREVTYCPNVLSRSVSPACSACLHDNCCAELSLCAESLSCRQCTAASNGAYACTQPDEFRQLASCVRDGCATECAFNVFPGLPEPACNILTTPSGGVCSPIGGFSGHMHCNPITNEPCSGLDEVCAFETGTLTYTCRSVGHAADCSQTCGVVEGDCTAGHVCLSGRCYRLCCDDGDCQPSGTCVTYPTVDVPVGACVQL